jgi:DNA-binding NarL/FixJ family response regulator
MHHNPLDSHPALAPTPSGASFPDPAPALDLVRQEAALLQLTPRQYEVLALMAKGYPLKKISRELKISVATVKTHTEALYQRLGVNNRNAAVYAATSRGATLGCWNSPRGPAGLQPPSPAPTGASDRPAR